MPETPPDTKNEIYEFDQVDNNIEYSQQIASDRNVQYAENYGEDPYQDYGEQYYDAPEGVDNDQQVATDPYYQEDNVDYLQQPDPDAQYQFQASEEYNYGEVVDEYGYSQNEQVGDYDYTNKNYGEFNNVDSNEQYSAQINGEEEYPPQEIGGAEYAPTQENGEEEYVPPQENGEEEYAPTQENVEEEYAPTQENGEEENSSYPATQENDDQFGLIPPPPIETNNSEHLEHTEHLEGYSENISPMSLESQPQLSSSIHEDKEQNGINIVIEEDKNQNQYQNQNIENLNTENNNVKKKKKLNIFSSCFSSSRIHPEEGINNIHDNDNNDYDGGVGGKQKKLDTFALEECGWIQHFTDDGYEYWLNEKTNEWRWKQFMSDVLLTIERNEGLGEISTPEDFTESTWVPPSILIAERKGNENCFGLGTAPLWETSIHEFQVFGVGIRLYFLFLKGLGIIFLCLSLLSIPSILLCLNGSGSSNEDKDVLGIYKYTLANIGEGSQSENGLFDIPIQWLGSKYKINEIGFILSIFVICSSFINLLGWLYFRYITSKVVQEALEDVVSIQDYSVFVTNVPSDITGDELKNFFSKLYDVNGNDWKDRDLEQNQLQHSMLYGDELTDYRVLTSTHEQYNKEQFAKIDVQESALSEIQLVFSDAESIGTFLNRQKEAERIKRTRAKAKMYANDTPLKQGPDEEKHEKLLRQELTMTYAMSQLAETLELKHKLQIEDLDCIGAFLIFNSAIAADRLLSDHKEIKYEKYKPLNICKKIPNEMYFNPNEEQDDDDDKHEKPILFNVQKAPPPEDILWENVHFLQKPRERFIRRFTTGLLTFCLLAISTLIVGFMDTMSREASAKLPDLTLCSISAKQPYLDYNISESNCEDVGTYYLQRPKSGNREIFDAQCHDVKKNSFFVIYDNVPNMNNYLNNSISYTNMSNINLLTNVCKNDCPYDHPIKCPCIGVYDKTYKNCKLDKFDDDTCIASSSTSTTSSTSTITNDKIDLKGSLTASCYCYSLMNNNINGMLKSYRSDRDLCTPVFQIFALAPVFIGVVSMTTAVVNILLASHIKKSSKSEGHVNLSDLEINLFLRMFIAQLVNTILVPLVVSGKPKKGWPIAFLGQIFTGDFTDFIYIKDGRVERGWFTNVGNGFVITFALIAIIEIVTPLFEYYLFNRKKEKTRLKFEYYKKKALKKSCLYKYFTCIFWCCIYFLKSCFQIIKKHKSNKIKPQNNVNNSDENNDDDDDDDEDDEYAQDDTFPMQSDLDLIFMAPPFELTHRYVHILTLSFLALLFGTGIPLFYPMATIACFITYWCDKFLLLRYNIRPEAKLDRQLQDMVNRYWGVGIILHLLFSLWILSNNIFSKRISYGFFLIKYSSTILPENGKFNFESSRLIFYFTCFILIIIIMFPKKYMNNQDNIFIQIKKFIKNEKTEKAPMKAALFTEEYYREMPLGYVLPEQDKAKGWKYDPSNSVRYKVSPDGRTLKTWEVIHENGLSSYWRGLHPKYREATKALEERLAEMQDEHENDDDDGNDQTVESGVLLTHRTDDNASLSDGSDSDIKIVMG